MSLLDNLFGGVKKQAADNNTQQPNTQQPAGNTQQPNNNQQKPSGILEGASNPEGNNTQQPKNPLDDFNKMWDTPNTQTEQAPSFNLPTDTLRKVATSQNFTQNIDPALMQKATSGDVTALMEVINAVGQNSYEAALQHTSTLSDKFVNARLEHEGKSFDSKVKQNLTSAELGNTPGFSHPVVKAQLRETAQRLAQQYPEATPQEIASRARDYIVQMANAINPNGNNQGDANTQQAAKDVTNWDDYLG